MNLLFQHFSLVLIAVTIANAAIAARRVPDLARARGESGVEARRFVWRAAAWLASFFALLELLTIVTGEGSPVCFLVPRTPPGLGDYLGWGLFLGWTLVTTFWVWFSGGAERLARFGPLFSRNYRPQHRYSPSLVRGVTLLWCLGTSVTLFVMPRPAVPIPGCNGAPAAPAPPPGAPGT